MTKPARELLSDTLKWAMEATSDPATAAADWLARDIEPTCESALNLLLNPEVSLEQLEQAKEAFKTMRIVGETAADRRLGARLYAATIAAGLVHHQRRISRQSTDALHRALRSLLEDKSSPDPLRALAEDALGVLGV